MLFIYVFSDIIFLEVNLMIRMKLHIKLAEHRLTQKQLSEITGIRLPTISAYCTDSFKMIPKEHLDIFCKHFKCNVEDLIQFTPEESAE
jgi:putative transcriptional regulator